MQILKRFTALLIALLLCLSVPALAESADTADGWATGLSPAKPFDYVDEVDLTARVGYFMSIPENESFTPCGVDVLVIYTPRADFTSASGTLTVSTSDGEVYATSDLADVYAQPMTDEDLEFYGWGSGTVLNFSLDKSLAPDTDYSVNIPAGSLKFDALTVDSGAIDASKWSFHAEAYGISSMTSTLANEAQLSAGDTMTYDVLVAGDAVSARVNIYTPDTLTADVTELTESGPITMTLSGEGAFEYDISFYDADGAELSGIHNSGEVQLPVVDYASTDELNAALNIKLKQPEGATGAYAYVIGGDTGICAFTLDDVDYFFGAKLGGQAGYDEFIESADGYEITAQHGDATITFTDGADGCATWYDSADGVTYFVMVESGASEDLFVAILDKLA